MSSPTTNTLRDITVDRSQWDSDEYAGTAEALIAAGLVTPEQLVPQPWRRCGYVGFYMPDGLPVPEGMQARRPEGFKVIEGDGPGRYKVRVYLHKDERLRRRSSQPPYVSIRGDFCSYEVRLTAAPAFAFQPISQRHRIDIA